MEERHESEEVSGRQLYEELKRRGGTSALTALFKYEGIQKLKAASREEVVALFKGSEYAVLQRIRGDTPRKLAAFLLGRITAAQTGAGLGLFFLGMMIMIN